MVVIVTSTADVVFFALLVYLKLNLIIFLHNFLHVGCSVCSFCYFVFAELIVITSANQGMLLPLSIHLSVNMITHKVFKKVS